jgi:putative membrane protein
LKNSRLLLTLTLLWTIFLIWSGIAPKDRATWWMEVAPVLVAAPLLWFTRKKFPLSPFIYLCIFVHGLLLMTGGHYTYAETPIGFWLQDLFHLSRNPFDRLGHFFQGFVPALIAFEILKRQVKIKSFAWTAFLTICVCMAISVTYEFIEWFAAIMLGQGADAFLGTQGDPWDTQWDMLMATIGASCAMILLRLRK